MKHPSDRMDSEIVNLQGGLFAPSQQAQVPLDDFRIQAPAEPDVSDHATTLVMPRVQLDSFAPSAASVPPPPVSPEPVLAPPPAAPKRWSFASGLGAGIAGGVVALVAMGLVSRPAPKAAPEAAPAAVAAAPTEARAAAVPEAAPEQPKVAEPVTAAEPAKEPVKASAPSKVAEVVKDTSKAPVAKAPPPVEKEAPAAASTADLPAELPVIPAAPKAPEVQFNRSSAAVAIAGAGMSASSCKDEPGSMSIPVSVTFASSGRATRATVNGGPLAGTAAGSCIAAALRGVSVPPFDGEPVTVSTSLHLR